MHMHQLIRLGEEVRLTKHLLKKIVFFSLYLCLNQQLV